MCITEPEWVKKYWDQIPYQWRYLRLRDYPRNKWLPGADSCEYCEAPYELQITDVDSSGNFGSVQIRIQHKPGCMEIQEAEGLGLNIHESINFDLAGWEVLENQPHKILGRTFWPLKSRSNIGPCLNCWKLIARIPLILFIDQGKGGELDFCWKCAEELGILELAIKKAPVIDAHSIMSEKTKGG